LKPFGPGGERGEKEYARKSGGSRGLRYAYWGWKERKRGEG